MEFMMLKTLKKYIYNSIKATYLFRISVPVSLVNPGNMMSIVFIGTAIFQRNSPSENGSQCGLRNFQRNRDFFVLFCNEILLLNFF